MVEQACLSFISQTGFHHGGIEWGCLEATIFTGKFIPHIPGVNESFFVPDAHNFKDIDAVYLRVDEKLKKVLVIPIQVTIATEHKDSEMAFYSRWSEWRRCFEGYGVETTFVWIVEDKRSWELVEAHLRVTRQGSKEIFPTHEKVFVTVTDIHPVLGGVLERIRKQRSQSNQDLNRPRQNEIVIGTY